MSLTIQAPIDQLRAASSSDTELGSRFGRLDLVDSLPALDLG